MIYVGDSGLPLDCLHICTRVIVPPLTSCRVYSCTFIKMFTYIPKYITVYAYYVSVFSTLQLGLPLSTVCVGELCMLE